MVKEQKFYNALEEIFKGAKIEGQGGFVKLLLVKENYYKKVIEQFKSEVENDPIITDSFKEDFYDKLCNFFDKFFSESGSIYFVKSASWQKVYEKIYTDNQDVVLFWKTNMLYYIKSDKIFNNQIIKVENEDKTLNFIFKFDVSELKLKQNNEKKELLYTALKKIKEKTSLHDEKSGDLSYILKVDYEKNRKKTKPEEIASVFGVDEYVVSKAIKIFEKQNTVDFFINKNAKLFLNEQLDLYINQILSSIDNTFDQSRLEEIKAVKIYAKKIIDFISNFENELVKIWNKPKFVLNSNYVITLDRLNQASLELIKSHVNLNEQIEEWKKLKLISEKFNKDDDINNKSHLPIDTKYFKDIELDILNSFENLDEELDGRIVHSENYQALNTLKDKFESKIECIYIDPPFNTGFDFEYIDNYQDSSWLSILNDRLTLAKDFLNETGGLYLHLDRYANYYGRILLNKIFGKDNYKAEIYWDTCGNTGFKTSKNNWYQNTNCILQYAKNIDLNKFYKQYTLLNIEDQNKAKQERKDKKIGWLDIQKDEGKTYVEMYNKEGVFEKKYIKFKNKVDPVGMIWTDILSFLYTQVGNNESYFFSGGQKPEHLLARMIQAQSRPGEMIMDFYAGSGSSLAVAKKLNRKFLGIELGSHYNTFYDEDKVGIIGRLKNVLAGDEKFYVKKPGTNTYSPRAPQLTRNLNWKGGGSFKYYDLEQYEDSLSVSSYNSSDTSSLFDENIYGEYTFFSDKKMLTSFNITKDGKMNIELEKLFKNIDLPETISNALGLPIKKITLDSVILLDGKKEMIEKYNYKDMTEEEKQHFFDILKPYLWWGE